MDFSSSRAAASRGSGVRQGARQPRQRRPLLRELLEHRGERVHGRLGVCPTPSSRTARRSSTSSRRAGLPRLASARSRSTGASSSTRRSRERIRSSASRASTSPGTSSASLRHAATWAVTSSVRSRVPADRRRKSLGRVTTRRLGRRGVHVGEDPEPLRLLGEARDVGERLLPLLAAGGEGPRAASRARDGSPMSTSRSERISPWRWALSAGSCSAARRSSRTVSRVSASPGGDQDLVQEGEHTAPPRSGLPRHLEQRLAYARVVGVAGGHLCEEPEGARRIAQPEPAQLGDPEREVGIEERQPRAAVRATRPGRPAIELGGQLLQLRRGGHVVWIPRQPVARQQQPLHRIDGRRRHRELQARGEVGVVGKLERGPTVAPPGPARPRRRAPCGRAGVPTARGARSRRRAGRPRPPPPGRRAARAGGRPAGWRAPLARAGAARAARARRAGRAPPPSAHRRARVASAQRAPRSPLDRSRSRRSWAAACSCYSSSSSASCAARMRSERSSAAWPLSASAAPARAGAR